MILQLNVITVVTKKNMGNVIESTTINGKFKEGHVLISRAYNNDSIRLANLIQ